MSDPLSAVLPAVRAAVAVLDADAVPLPDVTREWARWQELARLAQSAATLLARRVEDAGAWQSAGFRSAAEAMAVAAGTTVGAAKAALQTSRRLVGLPVMEDAVRSGALSPAKVEAVAAAAVVAPDAQAALVGPAAVSTLRDTRDACLAARMVVEGDELYERARRNRRCVEFRDGEGAWNLQARGPVDAGAEVRATLDHLVDELFDAARSAGAREPREVYAFDALVLMARRARGVEPATVASRKPLALLRIDVEALRRGAVAGDETCEIVGLGPIPVRVAREVLGDAVLKLVITKGTDVARVTHLGRGPTAAQRAALLWESPCCRVEGCASFRLEIDHRTPWAATRRTQLDELDPLCAHHHGLKTRRGWALVEGSGRRPMVAPHDRRHPRHGVRAREPA